MAAGPIAREVPPPELEANREAGLIFDKATYDAVGEPCGILTLPGSHNEFVELVANAMTTEEINNPYWKEATAALRTFTTSMTKTVPIVRLLDSFWGTRAVEDQCAGCPSMTFGHCYTRGMVRSVVVLCHILYGMCF